MSKLIDPDLDIAPMMENYAPRRRDYGPKENPYAPIDASDVEVIRMQTTGESEEHPGYGQVKDLALGLVLVLIVVVAIAALHAWGS